MKLRIMRLLTVLFLVSAGLIFAYEKNWIFPAEHSCCASAQGQEEEEGNPSHAEPSQHCSPQPKAGQVGCKCSLHKKCVKDTDEEGREVINVQESKACKSWCFRHWCLCPDPPCA